MELDKDTIFVLTREDVIECAREMNIPEEAITDDVLRMVKKGVDNGLECWSMVGQGSHQYGSEKLTQLTHKHFYRGYCAQKLKGRR